MLEKDTSHQMQMRFTVSEQERHKTVEELERTQLVNKDLVQSLSLFEVSFQAGLVCSEWWEEKTGFAFSEQKCQKATEELERT